MFLNFLKIQKFVKTRTIFDLFDEHKINFLKKEKTNEILIYEQWKLKLPIHAKKINLLKSAININMSFPLEKHSSAVGSKPN